MDWDIELQFRRIFEMPEMSFGAATIRVDEHSAVICLRDPDDIGPNPTFRTDADIENTLLHELVHIKLSPLHIPSELHTEQEQIVEGLTRILLRFDRRPV